MELMMISRVVQLLNKRVSMLFSEHPLASLIPLLLFSLFLYKWQFPPPSCRKNLPPSPPKLPIIGNLHQLRGSNTYRALRALSQRYGGLMFLQLGSKPTVVVSSKEMASLVLKTFDASLIGRPDLSAGKHIFYNSKDIIFAPYGEQWKHLRSICTLNLLSNRRVKSFCAVREDEVALLIGKIKKSSEKEVNVSELLFSLSNHLICRAAFGRDYDGEGSDDFDELMRFAVTAVGTKNIENFLPWMGWINWLNGVNANLRKISRRFDRVLERIIQEHEDADGVNQTRDDSETTMKDFVDILLQVQRDNLNKKFTLDKEITKAVILDMFAAGTHTSYTTLEWTLTELLRHPRIMKRLQEEVRGIAGAKELVIDEDVERMPYLKAVIKESLRFHPPIQIPFPRECTEEVKLKGYDIPVGTQILINVWAIARDPTYWEDPEEFIPERFLDSPIDFKGLHFEYLPFGGGRRVCPGISFTTAITGLALANLMCHFDWSLPKGRESESIDISETNGTLAHKKTPLIAVATPWMAE